MPPKLRASQEAFDAAVQENIDEFDMEPEEALRVLIIAALLHLTVQKVGLIWLCESSSGMK